MELRATLKEAKNLIRRSNEKKVEYIDNHLQGEGRLTIRNLLNGPEEMYGKGRVFTHSTLEPGASIGFHIHENEAETYYIYSGEGEFNDNGVIKTVSAGDVTFTGVGEGHGLKNSGREPLEFIALILYK
ncbi:MAG: cupin domain-containing protein [Firmicutes bacterium]|nr:cupin domain-containing protein [Bacillota bacterium]